MWEVSLFPTASRPTLGPMQLHGWMGPCNGISPLVGFLWLLMQHFLTLFHVLKLFCCNWKCRSVKSVVYLWPVPGLCHSSLLWRAILWSWCEASVLYNIGNASVSCRMKTFIGIGCSADHLACEPFYQSLKHVYNAWRLCCCCCWWWWSWQWWCVIELYVQLTLSSFLVWLWKHGILEMSSGSFVRWE